MAAITQLRPFGASRMRYGSFAGRTPFVPPPVTQVTSRDVSGHGRPDRRLSVKELAELHVEEAFRNTVEPLPKTEISKDSGTVRPPPQTPPAVKVVNLEDYRSPSFGRMDDGIGKLQKKIDELRLLMDKVQQPAEVVIAGDPEEELAITLLLLD